MNPRRNTFDEMIAVINAYQQGKELQRRQWNTGAFEDWKDCGLIAWDFSKTEYRIKPEPPKLREWWVAIFGGNIFTTAKTENELREFRNIPAGSDIRLVREVIPYE